MQFKDTFICAPMRTPVAKFGGAFKGLGGHELGASVVKGLLEKTQLPAEAIDDVLFAQCYPTADAPAIGRVVALDAGLPVEVCGMHLDRRCGSGLQAVINAVLQVASGGSELVLAGGAESMSKAPFYSTDCRWGAKSPALQFHDSLSVGRMTPGGKHHPVAGGMIETAENLRKQYQISREEQDQLAYESQMRASRAQDQGLFDDEIVPITVTSRKSTDVISRDEGVRPETNLEALAGLKPIRSKMDSEATVTAGNASTQNDGASVCIVASQEAVDRYGLTPMARLVSWGVAGVGPAIMGIGPVPATKKALDNAGLTLADIDVIELNEAFASQVLACTREWQFTADDFARMNVNGSGISLGHPVGATGGRILANLLREMQRRDARYGLETMCIGGGQGLAAVFEKA